MGKKSSLKKITNHKNGFPLFSDPIIDLDIGRGKKVVISDIWAFWYYLVKKFVSRKQKNNEMERELLSYLEQAKYFYESAEKSPIKSKPLLYYYSFLNLSKVICVFKKNMDSLRNIKFIHGISEVYESSFDRSEVSIKTSTLGAIQVAHEIFKIFDDSLAPNDNSEKHNFNIKKLLSHCVGIHRAYTEIYNIADENFIKIEKYFLFRESRKLYFLAYLGELEDNDINKLRDCNYKIYHSEERIPEHKLEFFSKYNFENKGHYLYLELDIGHYGPLTKDNYRKICKEIRRLGIWYFIGNNGYTIYLSKNQDMRYSQESIIYMTMFFLGSITRYNPYLFDSIFSDKEQWLMSEFLTTQPKQFLYLTTARILGRNILKAYSSF
jgi:hypothetical protein